MQQKLTTFFSKYLSNTKVLYTLVTLTIFLSILTYYYISKESTLLGPDPTKVMGFILVDLVLFLSLGIILTRRFLTNKIVTKTKDVKSLQSRIILAFSLVAAVPTIIVSIFSTYFFHFGLQAWFDKKISTVLDQSIIVAESYLTEHSLQLKETALSLSDDLNRLNYITASDPLLFNKTLNAEAEVRSLDEAIIFQKSTNSILAQTPLSFLLSFSTIPLHIIAKAEAGAIVEIKTDPAKIRALIKLKGYDDTYLLIGRIVDKKIIDHINKTNGAAQEYNRLKKHILSMQVKFSVVFIFIALLLLLAAISWGAIIASQIVRPIHRLVYATEKVNLADLTIQVPEQAKNIDEISILSSAFNKMIKQIDQQQKDLVIAQRALAWSDIARRVAHEIKNPLTPILLSAERLMKKFEQDAKDKEAFNRHVKTIINNVNDIQKIVSEFVNFTRLPSPVFANCEIISLIGDIIESRKLINEKIVYIFHYNEPRIDFICDKTQITQIIVNLLKNSEEALENIFSPQIDVSITKSIEFLSIAISDNGNGFPINLIDKVTEAYFTTRSKGTGLGLAIVKKLTQDHCGTLKIDNKNTRGAIIRLIFNIKELKNKVK